MLTVSRPVGIFIAASVVAIGSYAYMGTQSSYEGAKLARTSARRPDKPTDFTEEDYLAHFDPPKENSALRNVFNPLLRNDAVSTTDAGAVSKDILKVPANLAGGNPNWIFTGYAVISGVKTALLEDQTTHHSEFVGEGVAWKTSRVLRISSGSVVFDDLAGSQVAVMRFDPLLASKAGKASPDAGTKPVDPGPALQGPIGQPGGPPPGQPRIRRGGMAPGGTMVINGTTFSISGD